MYLLGFMGGYEMILILAVVLLFIMLPLSALISTLKNDFSGNDKLIWVLLVLFLPVIGSIIYFAIGRSQRLNKKK